MPQGGYGIHTTASNFQAVGEEIGHKIDFRFHCRQSSPDTLSDLDVLMLLLVRRCNWNQAFTIANRLLDEFDNLPGILNAPRCRLLEVKDVGEVLADTILAARQCTLRSARAEVNEKRVIDSWSKLIDYVQVAMGHLEIEQFRCLFLNKKCALLSDEVLHSGTVDHTPVYPRELVKRALNLGSSALILAHNHPSGDPTPSRADITMTRQLVDITKPLGVEIHDHIIVARGNGKSLSVG